ncbi:hypothetical protein ABH905_002745 [Pseudomonas frederiksbergensis]
MYLQNTRNLVGASLLAKAVYQSTSMLNVSHREQARSHRGFVVFMGTVSNPDQCPDG